MKHVHPSAQSLVMQAAIVRLIGLTLNKKPAAKAEVKQREVTDADITQIKRARTRRLARNAKRLKHWTGVTE